MKKQELNRLIENTIKRVLKEEMSVKQHEAIKYAKSHGYRFIGMKKYNGKLYSCIKKGDDEIQIDDNGRTNGGYMTIKQAMNGYWVDPSGGVHSPDEEDPASMYESVSKKRRISEALKSDIIRKVIKSPIFSKGQRLGPYNLGHLKWDELEDKDIIKISPEEARKKVHYDDLILWFDASDNFLAASHWNQIILAKYIFYGRGKGGKEYTTTLQLKEASAYCYVITKDILELLSPTQKRISRSSAKSGANAFISAEDIKNANITRYKNIISKKHSENSNIDNKIKQIMKSYYMAFEDLIGKEDNFDKRNKLDKLNGNITALLKIYRDYVYIRPSLANGTAYNFQTKDIETYIKTINKLFNDLEL